LSEDIRLRVMRVPTNTPKGSANGIVAGNAYSSSLATVCGGAEVRTRSTERRWMVRRNRTNVKSSVPRLALIRISRRMARLSMRMDY
jgi:hypothetical protein